MLLRSLYVVALLEMEMRTPLITALAVLVVVDALGWGLSVPPVLKYALTHRRLPTLFGIRLLGGPLEALGVESVVVAGLVFVVVSGLKLLAAYWLWHARADGAVLEMILLGLSALFWYAFELPFGPLAGIPQVVLIALAWPSLVH